MGAFELQDTAYAVPEQASAGTDHERRRPPLKDECIVAFKVYDSCRRQNCLTATELGPARNYTTPETLGDDSDGDTSANDIIAPPANAASVTMDSLRVINIMVMDKQPSPFRAGYWDVSLKFVFGYNLTFREVNGNIISPSVEGTSSFNMRTALFGSVGGDLTVGTDIFNGNFGTFSSAPFIWAEAKAVVLDAKIESVYGSGERTEEVHLTIGLFCVLKLIRLVHLNVQSTGFCTPPECAPGFDINPCEYFADLDFPIDIFSPPQKPEFFGEGGPGHGQNHGHPRG